MTRIVSTKDAVSAPPQEAPAAVAMTEPIMEKVAIDVKPASVVNSIVPSEDDPERYARFLDERRRTSMSVPHLKMHVADIPGYRTYWFNDDQGKIERAMRAGYEFVNSDEVGVHDFSLAGDSTKTGNQDMGTRVSMVVGTREGGQPMRAYLMKIREEIFRIDQKLQQEKNDEIARTLKAGRIGTDQVAPADMGNIYVRSNISQQTRRAPTSFGTKADI